MQTLGKQLNHVTFLGEGLGGVQVHDHYVKHTTVGNACIPEIIQCFVNLLEPTSISTIT